MFENVANKKNPPQLEEFEVCAAGMELQRTEYLASIAISLKRIADLLQEKEKERHEYKDSP